ncbi:MAG: hypothetical protein CMJ52_06520 [Planctomycetaceae bacterium]|nr:hypothetical protein [Planctomycetaceae bacterium]
MEGIRTPADATESGRSGSGNAAPDSNRHAIRKPALPRETRFHVPGARASDADATASGGPGVDFPGEEVRVPGPQDTVPRTDTAGPDDGGGPPGVPRWGVEQGTFGGRDESCGFDRAGRLRTEVERYCFP